MEKGARKFALIIVQPAVNWDYTTKTADYYRRRAVNEMLSYSLKVDIAYNFCM